MDMTSSSLRAMVQVESKALNLLPFRVTELQVVCKTPCSLYLWNYNRNVQRWKSYIQSKQIECLIIKLLGEQEKINIKYTPWKFFLLLKAYGCLNHCWLKAPVENL